MEERRSIRVREEEGEKLDLGVLDLVDGFGRARSLCLVKRKEQKIGNWLGHRVLLRKRHRPLRRVSPCMGHRLSIHRRCYKPR